jgi:hypothetical protein
MLPERQHPDLPVPLEQMVLHPGLVPEQMHLLS